MIKVDDRAAVRLSRETTETPKRSIVIGLGESNKELVKAVAAAA